jgi:hypothetical protein
LKDSSHISRVNKCRRVRGEGHEARMGDMRNAYKILVGKPEAKRPLGRPKSRWDYNIRIILREKGWEVMDWLHVAQVRNQWRAL